MITPHARTAVGIGFSSLRANPLRTILSTLGIVMGAAALAAVLAMSDGVEAFARSQIARSTDVQTIVVRPLRTERLDGLSVPLADPVRMSADDRDTLAAALGPLAEAVLLIEGTAIHHTGEGRRAVLLAGSSAPLGGLGDSNLVAGSMPPAEFWLSHRPEGLISDGLARLLEPDGPLESLLGSEVEFAEGSLTIVGIIDDPSPEDRLGVVAPFRTADRMLAVHPDPPLPSMAVRAHRLEDVQEAEAVVSGWLSTNEGWQERTRVQSMQRHLIQVQQGMMIFRILVGSFTSIALVVGGVGIMNVLLASVAERTREIGVRKAVGARRKDIVLQFLSESVAIAAVGSAVGLAMGLATAAVAAAIMRLQTDAPIYPAFTGTTLAVSALAAIVVGLSFGTYPALRASRLDPIDALRHD